MKRAGPGQIVSVFRNSELVEYNGQPSRINS